MKKKSIPREGMEPLFRKISELTRKQRIATCVGVVVVLVGLCGYFLFLPKYQRMNDLREDIQSAEQELEITKAKAARYPSVKKEHEAAQASFELAARALPDKEEIPSLLTGISQAGKASGLKFLLFAPQKENVKDFYAEIPVKMGLSGGYHDLGSFYDRLARISRVVNVSDFSVSSDSGSPGGPLRISCTAVTYKFIDQPAEKDANQKKKKR
ncbi:MAG: type 4a pilus biogenesis protein PilO [Desulfobacterales bacterium]|nr:type 4a pilus biogenesis protein PilO [Desulfobacterales bacterium]